METLGIVQVFKEGQRAPIGVNNLKNMKPFVWAMDYEKITPEFSEL